MDYLSLKTSSLRESPVAPRVQVLRAVFNPTAEPQVSTYRNDLYLVKSKALFGVGGLSSCKSQLQIPLPTLPISTGGGNSRCPHNLVVHIQTFPQRCQTEDVTLGRCFSPQLLVPQPPEGDAAQGHKSRRLARDAARPIQRPSYGRRGMRRTAAAVASQMGAGGSETGSSGILEVADTVHSECLEEHGHGCRRLLPPPQASPGRGESLGDPARVSPR